jgi:hypothetical protein
MSAYRIPTILALLVLGATQALAQAPGNPFAGRPGGGLGPYGNDTGAGLHLMQAAPVPRLGTPKVVATTTAVAGEESKEMPHRAEIREGSPLWEAMFVGCSAGAFLGGYTAWSTTAPVVGAELAAIGGPAGGYAAAALGTAAAIGCGLGAATATVSIAASSLWSWAFR